MRPEDYMTHDEALEVDGCMVCNRLDCICPPEEELSRTEATTDWYDHHFQGSDPHVCVPGGSESDSWEFIAAQLDRLRDKSLEYWTKRREEEYARWLERRMT